MVKILLFLLLFFIVSYVIEGFFRSQYRKRKIEIDNDGFIVINRRIIIFILLIAIPMALIAGLRSGATGVDTQSYDYRFTLGTVYALENIKRFYEVGFWIIYYICELYFNVQVAYFIFAYITFVFSYAAIFKFANKTNIFVLSLLYLLVFYPEYLNMFRQITALSMIMLSLIYAMKRKPKVFLGFIFLGFLFHASSLACLPIYLIVNRKINKRLDIFLYIIICAIFLVAFPFVYNNIDNLFLGGRLFSYELRSNISENLVGIKSFLIHVFPLIIVLLYFYYNKKGKIDNKESKEYHTFFILLIIYATLILGQGYNNYFYRLAYFYEIGCLLFASKITLISKEYNLPNIRYYFQGSKTIICSMYIVYYLYLHGYVNDIVYNGMDPLANYMIR